MSIGLASQFRVPKWTGKDGPYDWRYGPQTNILGQARWPSLMEDGEMVVVEVWVVVESGERSGGSGREMEESGGSGVVCFGQWLMRGML